MADKTHSFPPLFQPQRRHYCKAIIAGIALALIPKSTRAYGVSNGERLEITDGLGRQVSIARPPQRIVSIFSSNTELLHVLGATDRIVGIEDFTRYPPDIRDGRTIVGGRLGFSVETIARLEPDLVVMTPARQAVNTLLKPMQTIGVPVVVMLHRNLAEIFSNLSLLGHVLGNLLHAESVIEQLQQRLQVVDRQLAGVRRPRVYFETGQNDRGNFTTVRKGHYTYDTMLRAGAESIFDDLDQITQVSGEAIIAADPEVILLARNDGDPDSVKHRPGWQNISAVRNNRVFMVPRELFLIPGPRVVDGVEMLAPLLHPDIFVNQGAA